MPTIHRFIFCKIDFLICFCIFLSSLDLSGQDIPSYIKTIPLGDDTVQLKVYKKSGENFVFAHVHENEVASLEAGKQLLQTYGGKLVTIAHSFDGSTNRNVTFKSGNTVYAFDPNRIYSDDTNVLIKTIQVVKGSGKVDDKIVKMVKKLADQIWQEVHEYPIIVAIHNNKNTPAELKTSWLFWQYLEPESYSIKSYIKSHDQTSDSNQSCTDIYINPQINNSEFFIVTQKQDFDMLAKNRYNVVLQNDKPIDDGSMSVYAHGKNKRYINSEAKMGRVKEQVEMLEILLTGLFSK